MIKGDPKKYTVSFPTSLKTSNIAPCGMNCGICYSIFRKKNQCPGCTGPDDGKPNYCIECIIKNCEKIGKRKRGFCFQCDTFPCARLKQLDKRYRTKYGMSMIENLNSIKTVGIKEFIAREKQRWLCPQCGHLLCVHCAQCLHCGAARSLTLPRLPVDLSIPA